MILDFNKEIRLNDKLKQIQMVQKSKGCLKFPLSFPCLIPVRRRHLPDLSDWPGLESHPLFEPHWPLVWPHWPVLEECDDWCGNIVWIQKEWNKSTHMKTFWLTWIHQIYIYKSCCMSVSLYVYLFICLIVLDNLLTLKTKVYLFPIQKLQPFNIYKCKDDLQLITPEMDT